MIFDPGRHPGGMAAQLLGELLLPPAALRAVFSVRFQAGPNDSIGFGQNLLSERRLPLRLRWPLCFLGFWLSYDCWLLGVDVAEGSGLGA